MRAWRLTPVRRAPALTERSPADSRGRVLPTRAGTRSGRPMPRMQGRAAHRSGPAAAGQGSRCPRGPMGPGTTRACASTLQRTHRCSQQARARGRRSERPGARGGLRCSGPGPPGVAKGTPGSTRSASAVAGEDERQPSGSVSSRSATPVDALHDLPQVRRACSCGRGRPGKSVSPETSVPYAAKRQTAPGVRAVARGACGARGCGRGRDVPTRSSSLWHASSASSARPGSLRASLSCTETGRSVSRLRSA